MPWGGGAGTGSMLRDSRTPQARACVEKRVKLKTGRERRFSWKRNFIMGTDKETLKKKQVGARARIRRAGSANFVFLYLAEKSRGSRTWLISLTALGGSTVPAI
jgi:hypothetical protein